MKRIQSSDCSETICELRHTDAGALVSQESHLEDFPCLSLSQTAIHLQTVAGSVWWFHPVFQRRICQHVYHSFLVWSLIGFETFLNKSWRLWLSRFLSVNYSSRRCDFLGFRELSLLPVNLFRAEQLHWLDNSTAQGLLLLVLLSLHFNASNDGRVELVCLLLSPLSTSKHRPAALDRSGCCLCVGWEGGPLSQCEHP